MSDAWQTALEQEMSEATLGDPRLSRRLGFIAGKLARSPSASFPNVFDEAGLEAAYRFMNNVAVTPDGILSGHFEATRTRAVGVSSVLVVHDSTTIQYRPDGERRGLGRIITKGQGFFAHVSLVLASDGTRRPLGVAALTTWIRDDNPTAPSEKLRWPEQIEVAASRLQGTTEIVHVMDREVDDYAIFARLVGKHRFIIRGRFDRRLEPTADQPEKWLGEALTTFERTVEREVPLSKRVDGARSKAQKKIHPSRDARLATLMIGATTLTLRRPKPQPKTIAETIALNVVRVWEPDPPEGESAIEWVLWTTEAIDTPEQLAWIVDSYRARWVVEEFFKALKTGCDYEARQFEEYEGLVNALAIFLPIACQMLEIRSESRRVPDAAASSVLSEIQLKVLATLGRRKLSVTPTVREVLLAVAALGGHIKYSGEPGWLTLTRGFRELRTLTAGWEAAELQPHSDRG
jgi:transposase-like protein/DDE family transposase